MNGRRATVALAGALALASCSATPSVGPTHNPNEVAFSLAPLASNERALPTEAPNGRTDGACGGVGLDAILAGDPNDPHLVWLVNQTPGVGFGHRADVVWPAYYRVRFTPQAEVLDGSDEVRLRAGDHVGGGCYSPGGLILLEPPFE